MGREHFGLGLGVTTMPNYSIPDNFCAEQIGSRVVSGFCGNHPKDLEVAAIQTDITRPPFQVENDLKSVNLNGA